MGVIKKQSIQNLAINYFGIVLGYINVSLLFPKMLSMEEFGLTRILVSISAIFAQFSMLGIPRSIQKFFPFFKTEDKKNHGFFLFMMLIPLFGFVLITSLYFIFKDFILQYYQSNATLLIQHYELGAIISFLVLYCSLLESYLSALLKTVVQNFLRTVLLRIIWCIEVVLYYYGYIDFTIFIYSFVGAYGINVFLLLAYAFYLKQIHWKVNKKVYKRKLVRYITKYSLFSILSGVTFTIVGNIDQLMIGSYLGLDYISIYAVSMYISNVMYIPLTSLGGIVFPVISRLWREKNFSEIQKIYHKSSINLFITGGYIFIVIWASIDEYISILSTSYSSIKYVAFFLAMGKLFDMATGVNGQILAVSKFYSFETYSAIFLAICTIATNFILIPIFGITGAAIATALTLMLYNILRIIYLYKKLGMFPFVSKDMFKACMVFLMPFIGMHFWPFSIENIIYSVLLKSIISTAIFFILLVVLKPSEDIHVIIQKLQIRFFKKIYIP